MSEKTSEIMKKIDDEIQRLKPILKQISEGKKISWQPVRAKFVGKGTKGEKENFLIFLGTEGNDEPIIPFYVRYEGKYALQYKPSFFQLDNNIYYKVEVDRKIKDPERKLLEFGRIFNKCQISKC
jgi:hypothetical protein